MKKVFSILLLLFTSSVSNLALGQTSIISGIVNTINTKVTSVDPTCNSLIVQSVAGLSVGDTVLIIQMKGATMDESNTATFGNITAIGSAGNYEFAEIAAINGGTNKITLTHTIKTYDPTGSVQLIYVPQYVDVNIAGTITAYPWDGNTGGVVVFEASGTVTFNASIDVTALGFRGGALNPGNGSACNTGTGWYADKTSTTMAGKGEGIKEFILTKEAGRGKQVNGGGGGHSNNYGGGGGGNFGLGGRGGNESSGCNAILYPNNYFSIGGTSLSYTNAANKIYFGGGGGSGQENNYLAPGPPASYGGTPGGNGGGIVIINANSIVGNSNSIIAKGGLSPISSAKGDGAGGGGGGGTVLLTTSSYSTGITVDVRGGKGDDVRDETSRDLGPGGGGGGGMLWYNGAALNANITLLTAGGASGVTIPTLGSNCSCAYGSVAGSAGGSLNNLIVQKGSTIFPGCSTAPVELYSFTAKQLNQKVKLEWSTASEKNNHYFTIERTTDLQNFTLVGNVNGVGNSSQFVSYSMYDDFPLNGTSYYRLTQTDIDGTSKVIGIVYVKNLPKSNVLINYYPNPFKDVLSLELNDKPNFTEVNIKVMNAVGELVYETSQQHSGNITLNLADLSIGIYTLIVQSDDAIEIQKIIKGY